MDESIGNRTAEFFHFCPVRFDKVELHSDSLKRCELFRGQNRIRELSHKRRTRPAKKLQIMAWPAIRQAARERFHATRVDHSQPSACGPAVLRIVPRVFPPAGIFQKKPAEI